MDESKVQQNTPRSNLLYQTSSISSNNGTPGSSQRNSLRSSPANIPPLSSIPIPLVSRPPLNQYLKIAVIRSSTDTVLCNDPEQPGKKREVVVGSLPNQKQQNYQQDSQENSNKRDILVPKITSVKRYSRDVPSDYNVPQSYIRFNHPSYEEVDEAVEYNIDEEDENWWKNNEDFGPESRANVIWEGDMVIDEESEKILQSLAPIDVVTQNPRYYNSPHGTYWLIEKHRPRLPLCVLEQMMDVLEKATGFEMIVTVAQAENILTQKIPPLTEIFANKPPVIKETRFVNDGIAIKSSTMDTADKSSDRIPAFGPPITLTAAIYKVYNYWMQKRSRLKKPLLRRFWPATSTTDISPHMVFRPRDKEKRNLRKKRQNDLTSYNKMRMLKMDFEKVKTLCDLIVRREGVTSLMVDLSNEYYHQRLHEWLDTSGQPIQSGVLTKEIVKTVLDVPKYFDDESITSKAPKNKKRKRSSVVGSSVLEVDHSSFPDVTDTSNSDAGVAAAATEVESTTKDVVVAGHDGGLPAPSFLDPLSSREVYETNWSDKEPYIPYVENGKEFVPKTFQHRARLGRGGRIMIDRIPCASDTSRFITYGHGTSASGYHPSTLGVDGKIFNGKDSLNSKIKNNKEDAPRAPLPQSMADLAPPSLDNNSLSQRIQEICARGILDDFEQQKHGHDTDEILMPLEDFLDSPYYGNGNENYVIGPF